MEELLVYEVGDGEGNCRIDRYLSEQMEGNSRSFVQKLLKDGKVSISGKSVKASYKVQPGDRIEARVPEPEELEILPEDIPLDILYEDEDLLIVNKPKGMVVHPSAGHYSHTLVNAVLYHCQGQLSGINGVLRPGIVHRIDMDTTGALVVCKNDASHQKLAEQLAVHAITRRYRALVHGNLKEDTGTVTGAIGRHPTDRKKMAINEKNGKPAVTHYRVLERFGSYTYIECELETGRTHQIRVHMDYIKHWCVGDPTYGAPGKSDELGLKRQFLHSYFIEFVHPRTRETMSFLAPLPSDLKSTLARVSDRSAGLTDEGKAVMAEYARAQGVTDKDSFSLF